MGWLPPLLWFVTRRARRNTEKSIECGLLRAPLCFFVSSVLQAEDTWLRDRAPPCPLWFKRSGPSVKNRYSVRAAMS